jgi:ElaB/YqjD/DUF883 family membrane-anchored ribosome-binding protein
VSDSPHKEQDYDLANAAQGLKGCDAVYPFDERNAYEGLHRWAELLIEDRQRLEEQYESLLSSTRRVSEQADELAQDRIERNARIKELQEQLEAAELREAKLRNTLRSIADAPWKSATITGGIARAALARETFGESRRPS